MPDAKEQHEELERYETMMGAERGRLAVALDLLTDALVLAGQHGVYCRSNRNAAKPAEDIRMVTDQIVAAKKLIQSAMEEIRKRRESNPDGP